jgi:hypothetical protein
MSGNNNYKLTFDFPTPEARALFITFFNCFGEQVCWDWCDGKPGKVKFNYPEHKNWNRPSPELTIQTEIYDKIKWIK